TASAADVSARGPASATAQNFVWGTGYALQFANPTGWTSSDQRVLSAAAEYDLSGTNALNAHGWVCPSANLNSGVTPQTLVQDNAQFMIIQPSDVAGAAGGQQIVCNMGPDPALSSLNPPDQIIFTALRRMLPAGDWYIDMQNRCLVQNPSGHAANM